MLSDFAHSEAAFHRLTDWMDCQGFQIRYVHEFERSPELTEALDKFVYLARACPHARCLSCGSCRGCATCAKPSAHYGLLPG